MVQLLRPNDQTHSLQNVFTQLTASGLTSALKVTGMRNHTFQVVLDNKNTNVIVGISGSADGTNFGEMPLDFTAVTAGAITTNRITLTANGTYLITLKNNSLHSVKFNFISESGGSDATLDVTYYGQS